MYGSRERRQEAPSSGVMMPAPPGETYHGTGEARAEARIEHKNHDRPRHIWAISGSISDYLFFYTYNVHENL
eukprot:COSAG01_NODE_1902_length_8963_cov_29.997405_10_plen_72_part_00